MQFGALIPLENDCISRFTFHTVAVILPELEGCLEIRDYLVFLFLLIGWFGGFLPFLFRSF